MDTASLCMGCMQPKGTHWTCPHCGYSNKPRNPMVLPYQAVLNNKFLVGRILGKPGGFGVTYLAWDLVLHTTVAVKEYFPGNLAVRSPDHSTVMFDNDKDKAQFGYGLEQFLREARALAQFSHPNIVRVREFFQQNNTAYLVMDYYEGISLEDFVQRKGGKIPEDLAVNLLLPILDGLHQVHQKKMLHRDIKPANIYLTKGGTAILLDFGAARFAIGQNSQTISVILSAGFAPFEQYLQKAGELLGPWTDVYAYAAMLYAITTGITPDNAINRHQQDTLPAPIQIIPALSPRFSEAVMAALALDPEQRPQTAQAFQDLLLAGKTTANDNRRQPLTSQSLPASAIEDIADAATINLSSTTQDEPTLAFQETPPASETYAKTVPTSAKPSHFVNCPHCKALNNVASGQVYSQLHCRRCGKIMAKKSAQDSSPVQWLALTAVLLMLGWVLMKPGEKPAVMPVIAVPATQATEAGPAPAMQAVTENEPESHDMIETGDIETTVSQEEPATVTVQEPAIQSPTGRTGPRHHHAGFSPQSWPPESALEGCRGKQRGDACEDKDRPGDIRGICGAPAEHDDLACEPLR